MTISEQVKRRLWSSSGGFCQNPSCRTELFRFFDSGKATSLEQFAHVIAQKPSGPRGKDSLPVSQRDEFDNLIMLCPACHTIVDKNQAEYDIQLLLRWKDEHESTINNALICPVFDTRVELRSEIEKLLARNEEIFQTYGPHSYTDTSPISEAADMWTKLVLSDVIPNNRKICDLLRANYHLLCASEQQVVQEFRLHAEAFEYNHVSGEKSQVAPLFPKSMNSILEASV